MKHTSGQWYINDMPLPSRKIIEIKGDGVVIANVLLQHGKGRAKYYGIKQIDSETRANARLIAAAPDLLEACKLAAKYVSKMVADEVNTAMPPIIALNRIERAIKNAGSELK